MTDGFLDLVRTSENATRLAIARDKIDSMAAFAASRAMDFGDISKYVSMFTTYILHMNNYHGSVVYVDVKREWRLSRQRFLETHTIADFHDLLRLFSIVYRWMSGFNYAEKCYLAQYMLLCFQ
jgi:hypothetical protein